MTGLGVVRGASNDAGLITLPPEALWPLVFAFAIIAIEAMIAYGILRRVLKA